MQEVKNRRIEEQAVPMVINYARKDSFDEPILYKSNTNPIKLMFRELSYSPYPHPHPNNHLLLMSSSSTDLGRTSFSENSSNSIGGNSQLLEVEFLLSK